MIWSWQHLFRMHRPKRARILCAGARPAVFLSFLILVLSVSIFDVPPHLIAQTQRIDDQSIARPVRPRDTADWDLNIHLMVNEVHWDDLREKIAFLESFATRYKKSPNHAAVAESLFVFFSNLGLDTEFHTFVQPGQIGLMEAHNVVATQRGLLEPDSIIVICGHYDSMSEIPLTYAPGADDNASGVAAVMTAAQILSKHHFGYTIQYICFASEEYGAWGSGRFVRKAVSDSLGIVGALNFDMIGYRHSTGDRYLELETNRSSMWLAKAVRNAAWTYAGTSPCRYHMTETGDSDNHSFWAFGYAAINHTEAPYRPGDPNFNPHWHTSTDWIVYLDHAFTVGNVKVAIAGLATLAQLQPVPPAGSVTGRVVAECPAPDAPLYGVVVDAYDTDGRLAGSSVTNTAGEFDIPDLPAGDYTVTLITPLGYSAPTTERDTTVRWGETTRVDFSLGCLGIVPDTRGIGFWKHQFAVASGGNGHAQIDATTLCRYLDLVGGHFNNNAIRRVVVYEPPSSGMCSDKLLAARDILNLKGNVGMSARAKQHLFALLLNVAGEHIFLREVVSKDGVTVSRAITYCDVLIGDTNAKNDGIAKDIAETINEGRTVESGMIPVNTDDIAYAPQANNTEGVHPLSLDRIYPNPFNPATTIHFTVPVTGNANLGIYDIKGRIIRPLVSGFTSAGPHTVTWNGRDVNHVPVASGIYFVRLDSNGQTVTKKIVFLK